MTSRHVVFSHGKDSGPWGTKITALAETAEAAGFDVLSVDYRGIDSPADRVARLVEGCGSLSESPVLVGSSLGAFVSWEASLSVRPGGLFLMAPALLLPALPPLRNPGVACPLAIVHGWHDEVVPCDDSIRFARQHRAALHLLDSDHGLHDQLDALRDLFAHFLLSEVG